MKKYKIHYIIIYIIVLILAIAKGFDVNISIINYNDYAKGISNGYQGTIYISIINLIIVLAIWIYSLIITLKKNNKTKYKWLIFIGIILLSLFIPTGLHSYSSGLSFDRKYVPTIELIKLILTHL